jgi:hypothetical protein
LARLHICMFHLPNHFMYFDQMCHAMSNYATAGHANFVVVSAGYFFQFQWLPALLVIYNGLFKIKV